MNREIQQNQKQLDTLMGLHKSNKMIIEQQKSLYGAGRDVLAPGILQNDALGSGPNYSFFKNKIAGK